MCTIDEIDFPCILKNEIPEYLTEIFRRTTLFKNLIMIKNMIYVEEFPTTMLVQSTLKELICNLLA